MGRCEVVDRPCIWVDVYERARGQERVDGLRAYVPPPDRSLQGTSSWINYFLERDARPGREDAPALAAAPALTAPDTPISVPSASSSQEVPRER